MGEIKRAQDGMIKLESKIFELGCGLNALNAVHTAMTEGPFDPKSYLDALYCVYNYLMGCKIAAEAIISGAIESSQTGGQK